MFCVCCLLAFFLLFCSACDFCFGTTVERVFEGSYDTLRQNVIARSDSFKTYCWFNSSCSGLSKVIEYLFCLILSLASYVFVCVYACACITVEAMVGLEIFTEATCTCLFMWLPLWASVKLVYHRTLFKPTVADFFAILVFKCGSCPGNHFRFFSFFELIIL